MLPASVLYQLTIKNFDIRELFKIKFGITLDQNRSEGRQILILWMEDSRTVLVNGTFFPL